MTESRIAELLAPFLQGPNLPDDQIRAIQLYLDLLLKWNARLNLTAIRDPEEIVTRHFGESFFAARHLFHEAAADQTVIDIGSGAGFPGLPIKILVPSVKLTLVESNQRKSTFLREVVRTLGMQDVDVLTARAESLSIRAKLVTIRAVERFESILPIACRMIQAGGQLGILIGSRQVSVAQSVLPRLKWEKPVPIPNSISRVLLKGRT